MSMFGLDPKNEASMTESKVEKWKKSRFPMTLFEYLDAAMLEAALLYFSAVEDNKSTMFLLKPVELDFVTFP